MRPVQVLPKSQQSPKRSAREPAELKLQQKPLSCCSCALESSHQPDTSLTNPGGRDRGFEVVTAHAGSKQLFPVVWQGASPSAKKLFSHGASVPVGSLGLPASKCVHSTRSFSLIFLFNCKASRLSGKLQKSPFSCCGPAQQ